MLWLVIRVAACCSCPAGTPSLHNPRPAQAQSRAALYSARLLALWLHALLQTASSARLKGITYPTALTPTTKRSFWASCAPVRLRQLPRAGLGCASVLCKKEVLCNGLPRAWAWLPGCLAASPTILSPSTPAAPPCRRCPDRGAAPRGRTLPVRGPSGAALGQQHPVGHSLWHMDGRW